MTGKITSAQNAAATINYIYNDKGLPISETDTAAGTVKSFTYDSDGNRLTFMLTRNGQTEISQSYAYDKLNRLISVSENGNVIVQYSYDNKGNRTQTVSGGETTNYTYNIANLLTSQTTGDKLNEQYTYYLNGNQKTKTSNGTLTTYEYDGMNRLSKENDTEYSFDDFGNRKTMTSDSGTVSYTYDLNNRLTKSVEKTGNETRTTTMFYDKNGNQISKAVITNKPFGENVTGDYIVSQNSDKNVALYEYNCYNQLVGVDTNGKISSYTYAPDGMRASKTVDGNTINFVYDNANIVEEITADEVNKYFRGLEIIKNDEEMYYFYNGQGDVSMLADNAGNMAASYIFDAYGNQSEENTVYNPFGYSGEYTDAESGLVYLRARMYDSETGRFMSEDPAKDGLNWYSYCGGNPVMFVDPDGLSSIIFVSNEMSAQADVRREVYKERYNTVCYVVSVGNAKEFAQQWNNWFSDYLENEKIDAIEIISHGGATGDLGQSFDGTAYATGFLYFGHDPNNERLFARDTDDMNNTDAAITWLDPINSKVNEFNINGCNSANLDIYNIVYGFMQKVDSYNYTGFDGGAKWDPKSGDHVRGSGEYGTTWRHPFDPTYYVREYQGTWWKYVAKNNDGSPSRYREGRRWFQGR